MAAISTPAAPPPAEEEPLVLSNPVNVPSSFWFSFSQSSPAVTACSSLSRYFASSGDSTSARAAGKPAFYVPDYLHRQGYRILPVNPVFAGQTLWGEPVRATLADLGEPVATSPWGSDA